MYFNWTQTDRWTLALMKSALLCRQKYLASAGQGFVFNTLILDNLAKLFQI